MVGKGQLWGGSQRPDSIWAVVGNIIEPILRFVSRTGLDGVELLYRDLDCSRVVVF